MASSTTNHWDIKDKKEKPYMLFGSLCNYFGRAFREGRDKPMDEKEIEKLFKLCCKLVNEHIDSIAAQTKEQSQARSQEEQPFEL